MIDKIKEIAKDIFKELGSGFGVAYSKQQKELDLKKVLDHYSELLDRLSNKIGKKVTLKIEPGRIILASAGVLLVKVMNIKKLGNGKSEIAINAGFAEFARPRVYGAYHEIGNLDKSDNSVQSYDVRGNTVLQNDFLGKNRKLKEVKEGDFLLIKDVGAYGFVMASGFPGKIKVREIVI